VGGRVRLWLGLTTFFSDAAREGGLNYGRERTTIVFAEPEDCLDKVWRQRLGVNGAKNFFGGKIWFSGLGGNYAKCGIFAKWNFDNLANLKWGGGGVSQGVVGGMKGFGWRY